MDNNLAPLSDINLTSKRAEKFVPWEPHKGAVCRPSDSPDKRGAEKSGGEKEFSTRAKIPYRIEGVWRSSKSQQAHTAVDHSSLSESTAVVDHSSQSESTADVSGVETPLDRVPNDPFFPPEHENLPKLPSNPTVKSTTTTAEDPEVLKMQIAQLSQLLQQSEAERHSLVEQMEYQANVNSELKSLLIATMGDDLQAKLEGLSVDKVRLGQNIVEFTRKLNEDFEVLDKMNIQCDMWRTKFLASSVMIDELNCWRRFLIHNFQAAQHCVAQLLVTVKQLPNAHISAQLQTDCDKVVQIDTSQFYPTHNSSGSGGESDFHSSLRVNRQLEELLAKNLTFNCCGRCNDILAVAEMPCLQAIYQLFYNTVGWVLFEDEVGEACAVVTSMLAVFLAAAGFFYILKPYGMRSWNRNAVANKQRLTTQTFEELRTQLHTDDESVKQKRINIVQLGLEQLIDDLRNDKLTPMEVLEAFQWKTIESQLKYNCCAEWLTNAKQLAEDLYQQHKGNSDKPALYGVPFSVKENFHVKGYDTTLGLGKRVGQPAKADFTIVAHLKSLGAIPFVKSNVPMALMNYCTSNPIYGTTQNPYSPLRTCGGSSGGEAVLVATGSVPFGIGSDLGGSLRIPAAFCGIATLKCTSGRLTAVGAGNGVPGLGRMSLGYGFYGKTTSTVDHLARLTLTDSYYSRMPMSVPMPFGSLVKADHPVTVGMVLDDGFIQPVPAMQQAVMAAKLALERAGHTVVPFKIPRPQEAFATMLKCLMGDGGQFLLSEYQDEPVDQWLQPQVTAAKVPLVIRQLAAMAVKPFWPRISLIIGSFIRSTVELRDAQAHGDEYKAEFLAEMSRLGLSALICPAFPFVAPQYEFPSKLFAAAFSVAFYNLLDLPAGSVPIGKVSRQQLDLMVDYPRKDLVDQMIHKVMEGSEGMPTAVQVVSLPYREEICLQVMKDIEANL